MFISSAILILLLSFEGQTEALSKSVEPDASDVTWAHAVNSRRELERHLASDVVFLEADVLLGHVRGKESGPAVPIMAHPPLKTSDVTLEDWIDTVIASRKRKGVKLDFKVLDVLEESLKILQSRKEELHQLWLNADILPGPVDANTRPVNASSFLYLCNRYFPTATLSVGWTTQFKPNGTYLWKHVHQMAELLRCTRINQPVTFPVRAAFVGFSVHKLQWLVNVVQHSTLTVWSSSLDVVDVKDLLKLRSLLPKSKVFYDLPEPLNSSFQSKKDSIKEIQKLPTFEESSWLIVRFNMNESNCRSDPFVSPRTVLFTGGDMFSYITKKTFEVDSYTSLEIGCKVGYFITSESANARSHELEPPNLKFLLPGSFSVVADEYIQETLLSASVFSKEFNRSDSEELCYFVSIFVKTGVQIKTWKVSCESDYISILSSSKQPITTYETSFNVSQPIGIGFMFEGKGSDGVVVYDVEIKGKQAGVNYAVYVQPEFVVFLITLLCTVAQKF
ncbi:menorin-like isoform X1 [Tachypleus tridentatus]|uniref:menorin-like isoform X1 n=2 Tax=Tachypleus tridentatus TaxID=6853 RepID=UPI003FD37B2E